MVALLALAVAGGGFALAARAFRAIQPARQDGAVSRGQPQNGQIALTAGEGGYAIDLVAPDGSGRWDLTGPAGWVYDLSARWSSDGSQLAFLRYTNFDEEGQGDYELFVTSTDGSSERNLTGDRGAGSFSWSPDGGAIAFDSHHGGRTSIYTVDIDTGTIQRVTDGEHDINLSWSPDGSRIVFERWMGHGNNELFSVAPDGSHLTRLTESPEPEWGAAWAPDGSRIAFVRQEGESGALHVMNADGQAQTRLMSDSDVTRPQWSPDGRELLFQAWDGNNWNIHIMEADGTGLRLLAASRFDEVGPVWAPDGTLIAFSRTEMLSSEGDNAGSFDVYSIRPDGSGLKRLTHGAHELGGDLSWQPVFTSSAN